MKKKLLILISLFFLLTSFDANDGTPLFFGTAIDGFPISKNKLKAIESEIGIKPDMIVFFLMWPKKEDIDKSFNIMFSLQSIDQFGSVPCVSWEPMFLDQSQESVVLQEDIINGDYDEYIEDFLYQIKAFKKPVIIRFAHEMNLNRYHWGVEKNDYNRIGADKYKAMFQYVVSYFKKYKIKNALFAFCPNVDSIPDEPWNKIKNYYPGDKFVDILGMDGYNWGRCATQENMGWTSSWSSFEEVFKNTNMQLQELSIFKPVIIFETASSSKGGNKRDWIERALVDAKKLEISCINWFQKDKECDWSITKKQKNILRNYFLNKNQSMKDWIKDINK